MCFRFELKQGQLAATASLIVSWFFQKKTIRQTETGATATLAVKSTAWDVRFIANHTIMWRWNNWGAEGVKSYQANQAWSPVVAQSVIANSYLSHVNRRACLISHFFTYEWQHAKAPQFSRARTLMRVGSSTRSRAQSWVCAIASPIEYLPNVVSRAGREICSGSKQEMSHRGLMADRKWIVVNRDPGPLALKYINHNMF